MKTAVVRQIAADLRREGHGWYADTLIAYVTDVENEIAELHRTIVRLARTVRQAE